MSEVSRRSWYFVAHSGSVLGPCNEVKLTEKLSKGVLTADTLVWNGDITKKWTRLRKVDGLLPRLRRKSIGFSKLEAKTREMNSLSKKRRSYGKHLSPHVSIDEFDIDTQSVLSVSDAGSEFEEKCPVLSPRPLLNGFMSEGTDILSGFRSARSSRSARSLRSSVSSHSGRSPIPTDYAGLQQLPVPKLAVSPDTSPSSMALRVPLIPRSSESPLSLAGDITVKDDYHSTRSTSDSESGIGDSTWFSKTGIADDIQLSVGDELEIVMSERRRPEFKSELVDLKPDGGSDEKEITRDQGYPERLKSDYRLSSVSHATSESFDRFTVYHQNEEIEEPLMAGSEADLASPKSTSSDLPNDWWLAEN